MKRYMIVAASAGLLLAAQSLTAQAGEGEERRLETSGVQSAGVDVTRLGTMTGIDQPLHISDDAEYRRDQTFKSRRDASAGQASVDLSRWGPLHISDDRSN